MVVEVKVTIKKNKLKINVTARDRLEATDWSKCALCNIGTAMVAILEAKYHSKCLASYYYETSALKNDTTYNSASSIKEGLAFAELVAYIEELHSLETRFIKLADLCKLYTSKLTEPVVDLVSCVHSTRLKNWILCQLPDLRKDRENRYVLPAQIELKFRQPNGTSTLIIGCIGGHDC